MDTTALGTVLLCLAERRASRDARAALEAAVAVYVRVSALLRELVMVHGARHHAPVMAAMLPWLHQRLTDDACHAAVTAYWRIVVHHIVDLSRATNGAQTFATLAQQATSTALGMRREADELSAALGQLGAMPDLPSNTALADATRELVAEVDADAIERRCISVDRIHPMLTAYEDAGLDADLVIAVRRALDDVAHPEAADPDAAAALAASLETIVERLDQRAQQVAS